MKNKLYASKEFMGIASEISSLSTRMEYEKISLLMEKRQQYIEEINAMDKEIKAQEAMEEYIESNEDKKLKNEIHKTFKEIVNIDNTIRKNINIELKNLKNILNQPETSASIVNIKA